MNYYDPRIYKWIVENDMMTENAKPYAFDDFKFLLQPLMDMHPKQVYLKAAQLGMTVTTFLKVMFFAQHYSADVIYTLPTKMDVMNIVNDKFNRMIHTNPVLQEMTEDRDTVEQKTISNNAGGQSMVKFRGTSQEKDAISVSSDLNVHDELDASNPAVVEQYVSRLQASEFKDPIVGNYEWYFSHPSFPNIGVDEKWRLSDQKHWIITCSGCEKKQYLSWPESFDMDKKIYVCKKCGKEITDDERRYGQWIARKGRTVGEEYPYSGYWMPLMINPRKSARDIIELSKKDQEFFYTKVLGLPYRQSDKVVARETIIQNVVDEKNLLRGRTIIGVDTGLTTYGVVGNNQGIFYYWEEEGYDEFEKMMELFPEAIAVFDAQGDLRKPRELAEKYPDRIYFAYYKEDAKNEKLVEFSKDENTLTIQRNKMIDFLITEFALTSRIQLKGKEEEWEKYAEHWTNIFKEEEETKLGVKVGRWKRGNKADHWVHSTVYWRAGVSEFGGELGGFVGGEDNGLPKMPKIGLREGFDDSPEAIEDFDGGFV